MELVLVSSLLMLLLLVCVALGRVANARLHADDAAHQAARAASLARTPGAAQRQAQSAAAAALAGAGPSCTRFTVAMSGDVHPGGVVHVRVSCTAVLATAGLPGQVTVTKTAASVIDRYRGTALEFANSEVPWSANRSVGAEQ